MKQLHAYIINLDRAPERWVAMEQVFKGTTIVPVRVAAVDGRTLSLRQSDFDAARFQRWHGRFINIYEVACYLSHLKALQTFLESGEEHALIAEDDLLLESGFCNMLEAVFKNPSRWNLLRLTGLNKGRAIPVGRLTDQYSLCVQLARQKGAGAYLVDRKAASVFINKLSPMWLPWDHAFDREWFFGLNALSVIPFPISQTTERFPSTIQKNSQPKLVFWRRWLTTYPYQIFNEVARWICRGGAILAWKLSSRKNSPSD